MLTSPMDILALFPVRKTKLQKQQFREALEEYAGELGYSCRTEEGSFGSRNLIIGDPENAKYLITAHYDTPAILPFNVEIPTNPVLQVLFQLILMLCVALPAFLVGGGVGLAVLFSFASGMPPEDGVVLGAWMLVVWIVAFVVLFIAGTAMLYVGPANKNNANDNTSGVVTLLEILRSLPENQRHKVCFVLFDLREAGMIGSASYRKKHRAATDRQLVINLDCVGDGNYIRMVPTGKLKKDRKRLTSLYRACGYFGKKSLLVHEKGFFCMSSDHKQFPYGVGITALHRRKMGMYLGRIHTRKDTILEETNVNILRAALISFVSCDAAQ